MLTVAVEPTPPLVTFTFISLSRKSISSVRERATHCDAVTASVQARHDPRKAILTRFRAILATKSGRTHALSVVIVALGCHHVAESAPVVVTPPYDARDAPLLRHENAGSAQLNGLHGGHPLSGAANADAATSEYAGRAREKLAFGNGDSDSRTKSTARVVVASATSAEISSILVLVPMRDDGRK